MEIEKQPTNYLPRPRGHDLPLNIGTASTPESSSIEWIEKHGLKAKKLSLYQVLAPNAYSCMEDYIPILNKTVQSLVHQVISIIYYFFIIFIIIIFYYYYYYY